MTHISHVKWHMCYNNDSAMIFLFFFPLLYCLLFFISLQTFFNLMRYNVMQNTAVNTFYCLETSKKKSLLSLSGSRSLRPTSTTFHFNSAICSCMINWISVCFVCRLYFTIFVVAFRFYFGRIAFILPRCCL